MAARLLARARANGKTVTPGNIAYYTMLHIRCGRRSNSAGRSDVMGTRTQIMGLSRAQSLEAPLAPDDEFPDDTFTLGEVLASEAEDPSETAARNLDWQAFLATLDDRAVAILNCLAREIPLQTVADANAVSRSTVQTWRQTLPQAVRACSCARRTASSPASTRWASPSACRRRSSRPPANSWATLSSMGKPLGMTCTRLICCSLTAKTYGLRPILRSAVMAGRGN